MVVDCDEQKIKVIVDNLLSNAVKFSPSGGRIRIWTSKTAGMVQLDIVDAGLGVDEADREKVFEPFYQGRRYSTAMSGEQVRAIHCARVCAGARWQYRAYTAEIGVGAHFRLTIPIRDPEGPS